MQKITKIVSITILGLLVVACDSKPQFDVINDNNSTEFVAARIDDAGSGTAVGSNIDLYVEGMGGMLTHRKGGPDAPDMEFPDPYDYILVMCGNLMGNYDQRKGRLTNKSSVMFGMMQSEGDPAFKLGIEVCEIDEGPPVWNGVWQGVGDGVENIILRIENSDETVAGQKIVMLIENGKLGMTCTFENAQEKEVDMKCKGEENSFNMVIKGDKINITFEDNQFTFVRAGDPNN